MTLGLTLPTPVNPQRHESTRFALISGLILPRFVGGRGAGQAIDAFGFDAIWWWYYAGTAALLLLIFSCPFGGEDEGPHINASLMGQQSGSGSSSKYAKGSGSRGGNVGLGGVCSGPLETLAGFRAFVFPELGGEVRGPVSPPRNLPPCTIRLQTIGKIDPYLGLF